LGCVIGVEIWICWVDQSTNEKELLESVVPRFGYIRVDRTMNRVSVRLWPSTRLLIKTGSMSGSPVVAMMI
jgi:hypothetical protein